MTSPTQPIPWHRADHRVVVHEFRARHPLGPRKFGQLRIRAQCRGQLRGDPERSRLPGRRPLRDIPLANTRRRHDRTVAGGCGWSGTIALNPFDPVLDSGGIPPNRSSPPPSSASTARWEETRPGSRPNSSRPATWPTSYSAQWPHSRRRPTLGRDRIRERDAHGGRGDWTSEGHAGGAYGKVIRWAFEQQGMYQPAVTVTPNGNGRTSRSGRLHRRPRRGETPISPTTGAARGSGTAVRRRRTAHEPPW